MNDHNNYSIWNHRTLALGLALSLGACNDAQSDHDERDEHDTDEGSSSDTDPDDSPKIICKPGEVRCADINTLETCAPTGLKWELSPCGEHQTCDDCLTKHEQQCISACAGPCERLNEAPSSAGCSFYATSLRQLNGATEEGPYDALIVANPDPSRTASVALYFAPEGSNIEELAQGPVGLEPGGSHAFLLPPDLTNHTEATWSPSMYRSGAVSHIVSDLPILAYLHSPIEDVAHSGSTLLLPEHVMTGDYVVYGHPPFMRPNYFSVIALEHQTTVRWWPTAATAGNELPLPFVEQGEMGEYVLNRFDNIRIDSSAKHEPPICAHDLSGTVISADKPIWVVSAVLTTNVPACPSPGCESEATNCGGLSSDFMMEQNVPIDYWGTEYVGPHAPLRGAEQHHWRVYAGADEITVIVDPPQPNTPIELARRGDWAELVVSTGTNLMFAGNGPFMPVQYVSSYFEAGVEIGAPAMVQMVPTAQFLSRYVFVTRMDFDLHFVQVIRAAGSDEVMLDGVVIGSSAWESLGQWEVATLEIDGGSHSLESADSFGALQFGYMIKTPGFGAAGYGYPVGLRAQRLFIP